MTGGECASTHSGLPPELKVGSCQLAVASLVLRGRVVEPVVDIACRLVTGNAVPLLHFADQLILAAVELIDFIVGQLAPLLFDSAFELGPLAFENVVVHYALLKGPAEARTLTGFCLWVGYDRQLVVDAVAR